MMRHVRLISLACALAMIAVSLAAPMAAQSDRVIAIKGGTVLTMAGAPIQNGTVLMRGGKIIAVGASVQVPAGAEGVDATGKYVMPGLIDAMTSIGIDTPDLNEASDPLTPHLRAIESYNPVGNFGEGGVGPIRMSESFSGGVTTMYIAP